jgi:glycerophosphoryl diester phosphodiesterase
MFKKNILAHRGMWKSSSQKNTKDAIFSALKSGFGIETDLRDSNGEIVISHDMHTGPVKFLLEDLLEFYSNNSCNGVLALNIKSDGLQKHIQKSLDKYDFNINKIFVFDMSIPDLLEYKNFNIPFYTRISEYEKDPIMLESCSGLWIDNFHGNFNQIDQCLKYINQTNKKVCYVSPELHKRNYNLGWEQIMKKKLFKSNNFLICTDNPFDALNYFENTSS